MATNAQPAYCDSQAETVVPSDVFQEELGEEGGDGRSLATPTDNQDERDPAVTSRCGGEVGRGIPALSTRPQAVIAAVVSEPAVCHDSSEFFYSETATHAGGESSSDEDGTSSPGLPPLSPSEPSSDTRKTEPNGTEMGPRSRRHVATLL